MRKRKKEINILTVFFISYKNDVKIFLKLILNHRLKDTHQHNLMTTAEDLDNKPCEHKMLIEWIKPDPKDKSCKQTDFDDKKYKY